MPPDEDTAWPVIWTGEAKRSLRHIPPRLLPAVLNFASERLAGNPLRTTHALREPLDRYRSATVGSFRVLAQLDTRTRTVNIVKVAYHADVYRPL